MHAHDAAWVSESIKKPFHAFPYYTDSKLLSVLVEYPTYIRQKSEHITPYVKEIYK